MTICFVVLSTTWGGAETVVYELVRHLRARGESIIIVINQEALTYYSDLENVEFFNIGSLYPTQSVIAPLLENRRGHNIVSRALSLPIPYLDEMLREWYLKKSRKRLAQFLAGRHIDVITPILEDSVPLVSHLAADLKTLKIVTIGMVAGEGNLRGTEPVHPLLRPISKWKAWQFRRALANMDRVVGPSAFLLSAWEDMGVRLSDRYVTVPNGVNVSELQSSLVSKSRLKGGFNLLFPGGSRFVKGGDLVIESLPAARKRIPDVHLYVAGDVPEDHKLRRMVHDLGLEHHVTFVGFLHKPEYRSLLKSADVLVMPSRDEAFGVVYLEAMALGKPIIAANRGGVSEVVKDGRNGLLVQLDAGQIADAVERLAQDEGLRNQISQNNLKDATGFDWMCIVDRYIEVYKAALSER